jgi:hypothetical protein
VNGRQHSDPLLFRQSSDSSDDFFGGSGIQLFTKTTAVSETSESGLPQHSLHQTWAHPSTGYD